MADTRMKIHTTDLRDDCDSANINLHCTVGMRRRLVALAEMGIFGISVEEVAERFVCRVLQELEGLPKL